MNGKRNRTNKNVNCKQENNLAKENKSIKLKLRLKDKVGKNLEEGKIIGRKEKTLIEGKTRVEE